MRLDLARAYFLDKNYPGATLQLELIKAGNTSATVVWIY